MDFRMKLPLSRRRRLWNVPGLFYLPVARYGRGYVVIILSFYYIGHVRGRRVVVKVWRRSMVVIRYWRYMGYRLWVLVVCWALVGVVGVLHLLHLVVEVYIVVIMKELLLMGGEQAFLRRRVTHSSWLPDTHRPHHTCVWIGSLIQLLFVSL